MDRVNLLWSFMHMNKFTDYLNKKNRGKVLYFGDHVFSDLVDASIQHGWHTVSI